MPTIERSAGHGNPMFGGRSVFLLAVLTVLIVLVILLVSTPAAHDNTVDGVAVPSRIETSE